MVQERERGLGKCVQNHAGSYGYPTRPEDAYPFCHICGNAMVWGCPACGATLPDDGAELAAARFCRQCGSPLFEGEPHPSSEPPASRVSK
jgi:hypothetical protein